MSKERDFVEIAIRDLAVEAELSVNLLNIFSRILSRQITIDENTNQVEYGTAFDNLLSVFTFVATDPNDRPSSPFEYGERVAQAKEEAKAEIFGQIDDVFNIIELKVDVINQTLMGTSNERDIFIVPIQSDDNGAFATFGDAAIKNYQRDDGDVILFVDAANQWNSLQDVLAEVQPQSGNATILFNNNPEVAEDAQTNSLQIEGAMTTLPFANTLSDLANVDMHVVTEQEVNETGSIESYLDLWLA